VHCVSADGEGSFVPRVEDVNESIKAAYLGCASYRDSGEVAVTITTNEERRKRTTMQRFTTAFVRPDRFRFEYREVALVDDEGDRYLIHSEPGLRRSWWTLRPGTVDEHSSVLRAIAGAAGVSHGVTRIVPSLLFAREFPKQLGLIHDLDSFVALDDYLEGHPCIKLERHTPHVPPPLQRPQTSEELDSRAETTGETYWVDATTFLLRRIDEEHRFRKFTSITRICYSPSIDISIDDTELRFDPDLEDRPT